MNTICFDLHMERLKRRIESSHQKYRILNLLTQYNLGKAKASAAPPPPNHPKPISFLSSLQANASRSRSSLETAPKKTFLKVTSLLNRRNSSKDTDPSPVRVQQIDLQKVRQTRNSYVPSCRSISQHGVREFQTQTDFSTMESIRQNKKAKKGNDFVLNLNPVCNEFVSVNENLMTFGQRKSAPTLQCADQRSVLQYRNSLLL